MFPKNVLRKQALQARIMLSSQQRQQASRQIATLLQGWQLYREAHRVCFYASFGSEVDTLQLLDGFFTEGGAEPESRAGRTGGAVVTGTATAAMQRELYLPRVVADELVLHRIDAAVSPAMPAADVTPRETAAKLTDRLWRSAMGMLEPGPDLPQAHPGLMDMIIVPGSAFSVQGHRLGYGKGFYDRLLAQAPQALKVGLAFDVQLFPAADFPQEPHDVQLDWLVTESGICHSR